MAVRTAVGRLGRRNTLDELSPPERVTAGGDGALEVAFDLPMPGVSCLDLVPWDGRLP